MPLPTDQAFDHQAASGVRQRSNTPANQLSDTDAGAVYDAYVAACPQFDNADRQIAGWRSVLTTLADAGFSSSFAPRHDIVVTIDDGGAAIAGGRLHEVLADMANACAVYTHQRLSRNPTVARHIVRSLKLRGRHTQWALANGLDNVPVEFGWPGAVYLQQPNPAPTSEHKARISAASVSALPEDRAEIMNWGMQAAKALVGHNAAAQQQTGQLRIQF